MQYLRNYRATMEDIVNKFNQVTSICEDINIEARKIIAIPFFEKISITVKFKNPELCFHTLIPWLYVLMHEAASRNLFFVQRKFAPYNVTISEESMQIIKIVHAFRTVLQHNMDVDQSASDQEKVKFCEVFFFTATQKAAPQDEIDWTKALNQLLSFCIEFLFAIKNCIAQMSKSENIEVIKDEWSKLIHRNYTVFDFEKILITVLNNVGLNDIFDTNKICKKEIDKWRKDLDLLKDDFNFEREATRIIERYVLKQELLPINGSDIMSLGFSGRDVLSVMQKARELFYRSPCKTEDLITRLKQAYNL